MLCKRTRNHADVKVHLSVFYQTAKTTANDIRKSSDDRLPIKKHFREAIKATRREKIHKIIKEH